MAILGKRKAPEPLVSEEDAQAIFRRHFEARFNPLPEADDVKTDDEEDQGDEADSDGEEKNAEWGGLSDDEVSSDEDEEETPAVEVVDHSVSQTPKATTMSKRELKAFMSSRPPDQTASRSLSSTPQPTTSSSTSVPEDAPSLLAQDLELRRLLAESHLLAPKRSTFLSSVSSSGAASEPKAFTSGRIRQKATDLRIQALGSKSSILKQEKMPMHMRKGINAAVTARESKRRREAKENGIILERETGKKKKRDRRGGLGVDRPGVGRMRGAELRISERDVKSIEGTRDTFGRKGRR
ncbi:hypothetical protein PT974_08371 [Cladobotryum mycophilum]|uniref:Protein FAF1 n=1 Tax=Cladobotryum mycophilum TaxID=491253 RepID=A0ABR0SE55_9HYPO